MVEFEVAGIVEDSVASLASRAVLREQKLDHLRTTHARTVWLCVAFSDLEERHSLIAVVGSDRQLGGVVDLGVWAG